MKNVRKKGESIMEEFIKAFEEYCTVLGVNSNKSGSYAKGILYLCEYLNISEINEDSINRINEIKDYICDKNSLFYRDLLTFLERRNQKSYLQNGFIQAALNNFLKYVNDTQQSMKMYISGIDTNHERGEKQLSTKEIVRHINTYITAKGFSFDDCLVENYYLSLKSKPFVILAGTSGTGKTKLVKLFAEAIGATAENGRYKLVSVRPDWSDSSDLFGHVDLNGKFVSGAILDFINASQQDLENPYFLCLDEMNLARVEYYLSDILSIIETRECKEDRITTDILVSENYYGADAKALEKYGEIRIPENLYIIGTVNMDETTFPFSRKVLDRANTIEFSTVDFLSAPAVPLNEEQPMNLGNDFMKSDYIFFRQCAREEAYVNELCVELQEINKVLEKANAHVGYRVRDEIVFYMLNNKNAELLDRNEAFDNEIMQKILPRIQGSSAAVKNMLCELFKRCAGEYESYQTESDDISSKMIKAAQKEECKYRKSAEKIAFMVRRFEEDGFTAYWL